MSLFFRRLGFVAFLAIVVLTCALIVLGVSGQPFPRWLVGVAAVL